MCDDGGLHRLPGINVEVSGRTIESVRGDDDERFGIIKLSKKKNVRLLENLSIAPGTNEVTEELKLVATFKKQVYERTYKIWPEQPLEPLHRVGGGGGEPGRGRGTGGRGEDGQGGGQRPGTAACGRRIVGVHLDQPGDLRVRIAHQREGQDLAPDSRRGQQQVVVAGQVRSLVRQDGADLLGIQRLQRGGGQDHRRVRPADAVGGWLRMVDQRGAQVRVRAPDQAGGLRVLHRLPPDRAQVRRRGERGAGQHRTGQGEAEPGRGGAARRGVGVPPPLF